MCGITAVIALEAIPQDALDQSYLDTTEKDVYRSLHKIKHRGPDSEHVWLSDDGRVALGMNRLAINDLTESGEQPFHDATGNIHAIVNGEFYTPEQEREELASWYPFKGHSDCEVIIPLYLKYGMNFLSKLRGEFAFVLYDARRKMVIAARDRYGIKPLFYTVANNRLLISSEAKGFLPLGWKPEWDVRSLLDEGWMHDERSLFKRVFKIRAGYYLTCASFDWTQTRMYWDTSYPDKNVLDSRSEDEMILAVREKIRDAVKVRLRADVPIGIYLSGGIDSSCIAGIAVDILEEECKKTGADLNDEKKRLKCFCIGFDSETVFDETSVAKKTADMLGLSFHTTRMDDEIFADNFVDATYAMEQNDSDLNFVAKYVLSALAREHRYKVILTGEGSDEIFGGYTFFHPDSIREPDPSRPESNNMNLEQRRAETTKYEDFAGRLYRHIGMVRYPEAPGSRPGDAMQDRYPAARTTWRRTVNDCSFADQTPSLTAVDFAAWTEQAYGKLDSRETCVAGPDGRTLELINCRWHPMHSAFYLWTKSGLPNFLLTCLGDRMEMGHSLEGRPAFLDHELTGYVNNLPPSVKIRFDPKTGEFNEKWILREAVKPYVLDELYRRKKHPFIAPPTIKVGGKMHKLLASLVTQQNVENLGFLDWTDVEPHVQRAFSAERNMQGFGRSVRYVFTVAEWVVLSQKFGIPKAQPPGGVVLNGVAH